MGNLILNPVLLSWHVLRENFKKLLKFDFKSDFDDTELHGGLSGLHILDYDVAIRLSRSTGGELLHHRWKFVNLRRVELVHSTKHWRVALRFRDRNTARFLSCVSGICTIYFDYIILLFFLEKRIFDKLTMQVFLKWWIGFKF